MQSEGLVSSTECVICYEAYDSGKRAPRLLTKCGHCLCELCLRSLARGQSFKCPLCQLAHYSHGGDISLFPKNHALMALIAGLGSDKADYCRAHNEKFIFHWPGKSKYICSECFFERKMSREDVLPLGVVKKNLLAKINDLLGRHISTYNYLESHGKSHFDTLLKAYFKDYSAKLRSSYQSSKISNNYFRSMEKELVKTFSILHFLFARYSLQYDEYKRHYLLFKKLLHFTSIANTKRLTTQAIEDTESAWAALDQPGSRALLERSKEILSVCEMERIVTRWFHRDFVEWALAIIVHNNADDSGLIRYNDFGNDYSLFKTLIYDPNRPEYVTFGRLAVNPHCSLITLAFPSEAGLPQIEFRYDSRESVPLLQDGKWCHVF